MVAEQLHVVQSGVSAAIKALEAELGSPLFDRTSKRVDLTDAGRALLPRARATLDAARAARDAVDERAGACGGASGIGTMTSVGLVDLPALLGEFHRRYPEVTIRLVVDPNGSRGLVEALTAGSLDLALVSLPPGPGRADGDPAGLGTPGPGGARGPPAGRAGQRPPAEMAEEPFVDFPTGYGNRAVVDRAFDAASLRRHVVLEVTDVATGADFVRHGLGIATCRSPGGARGPDLATPTIDDADLTWPMAVASSSTRAPSAAARAMRSLFEDQVVRPGRSAPESAAG